MESDEDDRVCKEVEVEALDKGKGHCIIVKGQKINVPDFEVGLMEPTLHYYETTESYDPNDPLTEAPVLANVTCPTGKTYEIKQMQMDFIYPDYTIALYGKRRSGKTFFLRALMWHFRLVFPEVIIFTKTKMDREFTDLVPDSCIKEKLEKEYLEYIIQRQLTKLNALYDGDYDKIPYEQNINLMVVVDDCLADAYRYNKLLDTLFFNGRHLHIMLIITTQDCKGLPPAMKANVDCAVMWRQHQLRAKEAMKEAFCDFYEQTYEFDMVADAIYATDYAVKCVIQAVSNESPEKSIFAGVAPTAPDRFVMGSRDFWNGYEHQLYKTGMGHLLHMDEQEAFPIIPITYNIEMKPYLKFFDEKICKSLQDDTELENDDVDVAHYFNECGESERALKMKKQYYKDGLAYV